MYNVTFTRFDGTILSVKAQEDQVAGATKWYLDQHNDLKITNPKEWGTGWNLLKAGTVRSISVELIEG